MTFLAPAFFYGSLVVAAGIAALHFIVTRQPRAGILPTARFVPDMPATATARATRPSDIPLLLLRLLLVLAAGAGLAKPVIKPSRNATARVILADVSRSVGDIAAIRDSVRASYRDGDVLVAFDSSARRVTATDSLLRSNGEGNLSAGLIAAVRAGSDLRERADSIELVVISPLASEEVDAATDGTRALWPGAARVIVAGRPATARADTSGRLSLRSNAGDAFRMIAARLAPSSNATVVRDGSAGESSGPLVEWPIASRPRGAVARAKPDTIGGVLAGDELVVSSFVRRWTYPADSIRNGSVAARWIDGEPAALEWPNGQSCMRSTSIPISQGGDFVIRDDVVALASRLTGPCIVSRAFTPVTEATVARLRGTGGLASRDVFQPRADTRSALAPWLLALALLVAVAEIFVRGRRAEAARTAARNQPDLASAA